MLKSTKSFPSLARVRNNLSVFAILIAERWDKTVLPVDFQNNSSYCGNHHVFTF